MTAKDLVEYSGPLAFIGGGNMAHSLIGGLIARGLPAEAIVVADPLPAALERLRADYGVAVTQDNARAVHGADVVVCAVKPQELRAVMEGLREALAPGAPLLISIAAGIRSSDIQRWAGVATVRCMPNRPALQGCGVTALYAPAGIPPERRALAERILGSVGATVWLEREADMDAVTAISGSGPAYFFLLTEMLEQTGRSLGLSAEVSRKLAFETAYGSGMMVHAARVSAATLREQVTSRGGTTAAALERLEAHGVRAIFAEAITAAARRSAQMADELGGEPG
jgi:pyrroline-5-carboxylate reductase